MLTGVQPGPAVVKRIIVVPAEAVAGISLLTVPHNPLMIV
jgi:hypothetical protein